MFVKVLDLIDPVVLDGVRLGTEQVIPVFHPLRQNAVNFFVIGICVDVWRQLLLQVSDNYF